ncbi:NAD-dependent epimerase/dehydratase [Methylorubrum populi]|uniref:NAD-dependent epimerase/dehydratase n=1 Tax=Methylorubrum populi TaxID=223967 RepID=A0A160PMB6_9HYPH|nr:hypothetical protein [Methylorubrum populi]BAU93120.1 NAD-dependent epimerase/dehydratase [Methylorubrum populi]
MVGAVAEAGLIAQVFEAVIHAGALHKPDIARYPAQRFIDVNATGTSDLLGCAGAEGGCGGHGGAAGGYRHVPAGSTTPHAPSGGWASAREGATMPFAHDPDDVSPQARAPGPALR